jgi:hypothetical protein
VRHRRARAKRTEEPPGGTAERSDVEEILTIARPCWRAPPAADTLRDQLDLIGGQAVAPKRVAQHLDRQFPFAEDRLDLRAGGPQVGSLAVTVRSGDDVDPGIELARPVDDQSAEWRADR